MRTPTGHCRHARGLLHWQWWPVLLALFPWTVESISVGVFAQGAPRLERMLSSRPRSCTGFYRPRTTPPFEKFLNKWSRHLSRGYQYTQEQPRLQHGGSEGQGGALWVYPNVVSWTDKEGPNGSGFIWPPVRDQGRCSSGWAIAATDAVAAAHALALAEAGRSSADCSTTANGSTSAMCSVLARIPSLKVDQILGCTVPGNLLKDLPQSALDLVGKMGGMFPASRRWRLRPSPCLLKPSSAPYKVVMYEKASFRGWLGLLLAVSAQPVIVSIDASTNVFQRWTSNAVHTNVLQDPNCFTGSTDHTVLVVGYNTSARVPYWIIRNSWGPQWGDSGHIRLAVHPWVSPTSGWGYGMCGMYYYPGYYPVPAPPPGDPCYLGSYRTADGYPRALNPCGGGRCIPRPEWGQYSYSCDCSSLGGGFVAANNTVPITLPGSGTGITQTCIPVDVCNLEPTNGCGGGLCFNDGRGGYTCLCPFDYPRITLPDGSQTCAYHDYATKEYPNVTVDPREYPGLTCKQVYLLYGLTLGQLEEQNPGLNCSSQGGLQRQGPLVVSNPHYPGCFAVYLSTPDDVTCTAIIDRSLKQIFEEDLKQANPGLDCEDIGEGHLLCLEIGTAQGPPWCDETYALAPVDSCDSLLAANQQNGLTTIDFFRANPGLNCNSLDSSAGFMPQVCISSRNFGNDECVRYFPSPSRATYRTVAGDTCPKLVRARCFASLKDVFPATVCAQRPTISPFTAVCLPPKKRKCVTR